MSICYEIFTSKTDIVFVLYLFWNNVVVFLGDLSCTEKRTIVQTAILMITEWSSLNVQRKILCSQYSLFLEKFQLLSEIALPFKVRSVDRWKAKKSRVHIYLVLNLLLLHLQQYASQDFYYIVCSCNYQKL